MNARYLHGSSAGAAHDTGLTMEFFRQMMWPMWTAFTSGLEMLDCDISLRQKLDAVVSRMAHSLNHAEFHARPVSSLRQDRTGRSSSSGYRHPGKQNG